MYDTIRDLQRKKQVNGLIRILNADLPFSARSQAALALARIGDPRAILPLTGYLSDPSPTHPGSLSPVCRNALLIMGETAVPDLCSELIRLIHHYPPQPRCQVNSSSRQKMKEIVEILRDIGDERAVDCLGECIRWIQQRHHDEGSLSLYVFQALEAIGSSQTQPALMAVMHDFTDNRYLCPAISVTCDTTILERLRALRDPYRKSGKRRPKSPRPPDFQEHLLTTIEDIESGRGKALTEKRKKFRDYSRRIERMKNPDPGDVETIVKAIFDDDEVISRTASGSAARIGVPVLSALEASIPILLENPDETKNLIEMRIYLKTTWIIQSVGPEGIPYVLSRLRNQEEETFGRLVSWLKDMTVDERYLPELIRLYAELHSPDLKYSLIRIFREIDTPLSHDFLYEKTFSPDDGERAIASLSLLPEKNRRYIVDQIMHGDYFPPILGDIYSDESDRLSDLVISYDQESEPNKNEIRHYVQRTTDPESVEILVDLMTHPDRAVRSDAAYALQHISSPERVILLQKALEGPYPRGIKREIQHLINKIV